MTEHLQDGADHVLLDVTLVLGERIESSFQN